MSDNSLRLFGQWLVKEDWSSVSVELSPTQQVSCFDSLVLKKLNEYCPEKELKISSQDKPFITSELKKLKRQRSREYCKHGKSEKYLKLAREFKSLYSKEADKYLSKNIEGLMNSKPGRAFSILKRLGAQPGDCTDDNNSFTLPNH